jgi:hypothetical protein
MIPIRECRLSIDCELQAHDSWPKRMASTSGYPTVENNPTPVVGFTLSAANL